MSKPIRELHIVRVNDHKPIRWEELTEVLEADEPIYIVDRTPHGVIVADMLIGVEPQLRQSA